LTSNYQLWWNGYDQLENSGSKLVHYPIYHISEAIVVQFCMANNIKCFGKVNMGNCDTVFTVECETP